MVVIIGSDLIPVATICDQSATNIAEINVLVNENKMCTMKNAHSGSKYNYYIIKSIIMHKTNCYINNNKIDFVSDYFLLRGRKIISVFVYVLTFNKRS